MLYPNIACSKEKLLQNVNKISDLLHRQNRVFSAVVKGFCADDEIMRILESSDCDWFADSRIEDLKKLKTTKTRFLIRLSQICEISDVISGSEVSFESELKTILELQKEAEYQKTKHGIVLAIDMGDLREGCFYKDIDSIFSLVATVLKCNNLDLLGVGTNLGCFGGVMTDLSNMSALISIASQIENRFGIQLQYLSGMSTAAYGMIRDNTMPRQINHGRFGEIWLLGHDSVSSNNYPEFYDDVFIFSAQLIEIKRKPSKPIGVIGGNAFGKHIVREDHGEMLRGLLAFGTQDVEFEYLEPIDKRINFIGASSDHTIVEIPEQYKVGDVVQFKVKYHALLKAYTSKYVKKYIV